MDNVIKIEKVNSPTKDGVRYQVGLNVVSGTVWIETETSGSWSQVGENVDLESSNRELDALSIATEYLLTNEKSIFKRYN